MTKAMIIVNPVSGKNEAPQAASQLVAIVAQRYDEVVVRETRRQADAEKFARAACEGKFTAVYALGGDGTMTEVVNGIAEQAHQPIIGVIPAGTVNNYSRMLGMPLDISEAVNVMATAVVKKSDIGKINDRYFISSVAIGTLPETLRHVDKEAKAKYGRLALVLEGMKTLTNEQLNQYHITIDGKEIKEKLSMIVIAMGNSVAGISTFFPETTIHDGQLHFVGLKETTLLEKIALLPELFTDKMQTTEHSSTRHLPKPPSN